MQRRKFIKETGLIAIGVGAFGNVTWSKDRFVGDTSTTTDILGPFYRPGAPIRTNINPPGYSGQKFHLNGRVFKDDGKTPFKNALLEIWQCDQNRVYDNTSDDYRYRGSQKTGTDGKYHFICMHPIPYPAIEGSADFWRPAHIHLLISGAGQQDLITQVYLEGDPYLKKDLASASPNAVKRILNITKNNKDEEAVQFDIVMSKEFKPDNSVFEKLTGVYKMDDKSVIEFYREGDLLFLKWNGQIREALSYKGQNTFAGGLRDLTTANFQLQANNDVKVQVHFKSIVTGDYDVSGLKTFKYRAMGQ